MSEASSREGREEEILGRTYDARLMWRLLGYVRPYRWMTGAAVGLIVASAALQLVGPLATAVAVDLFMRPPQEHAGSLSSAGAMVRAAMLARGVDPAGVQAHGLAVTAVVFLAAVTLAFVTLYAEGYVMQLMGQRIMYDLRNEIFAHMQRLPVAFFDRSPIGRLVTRVTTDVDALNELFVSGLVEVIGDVLLLAGIAAVLLWLDWRLFVVELAVVPPLVALTAWFRLSARRSFRDLRVRIAALNAFLHEHVGGMAVVQLFGGEERAYRGFAGLNDKQRAADVRSVTYYAAFSPAVELISAAGLGMLIWAGGGQVARGALSLGALIAFLQYAQRSYQPLADLAERYNVLQGAMASAERIFALLDMPVDRVAGGPAMPAAPGTIVPGPVRGSIELDAVCFAYRPGTPVLRDVSCRVEAGETLAIVGATGAGKSTLANLLLRFYDVDSGAVRVDGMDVRDWPLPVLRRSIGMVLQDVFLFSGTVAANIRLGDAAIDGARVLWAAREVGALPFIERLPAGLDTVLRERGAGLSVGEKQLIAFARALAADPRILVLDEATSSIDTATEQLIQRALDRLLRGRTSLVIAHRLSTIQRADRILVLHKGEARELGSHQELLARRGIYHRLYRLQYQEQEGERQRAAR